MMLTKLYYAFLGLCAAGTVPIFAGTMRSMVAKMGLSPLRPRAANDVPRRVATAIILSVLSCGAALADSSPAKSGGSQSSESQPASESLSQWHWRYEVQPPKDGNSPWVDFVLPVSVFGQSREDLGDLRLYDGGGHERPYALRVREARDERQQLIARQFNRQSHSDHSIEVTLDLGEQPAEHNEIKVVTSGIDFRRAVVLESSDNDRDWGKLLENAWLVHYRVDGKTVDLNQLRYASSRLRYLRVRVSPDRSRTDDQPEFVSLEVFHTVRQPGEYVTRDARLGPREAERTPDGPGSAWIIDTGGQQVPCGKLLIDVAEAEFSRSYTVELLDDDGPRTIVANGTLERRAGGTRKPLEISFNTEVKAQRLRLVLTDHSNPPLTIESVKYSAAARQVVFAAEKGTAEPLRLYTGNPQATPPQYDFAKMLPVALTPPPARAALGEAAANPDYQPPPKPWTERWPWLIYVVLACASLTLLAMLGGLARAAIRRHDAISAVAAG